MTKLALRKRSARTRVRAVSLFVAGSACAALLAIASPVAAEEPGPAFMRGFFPPELVMQNQRAIGLSKAQRKTITAAIQRTQAQTLELQWSIQAAAGEIGEAVDADPIDADAVIGIAEKMMAAEGQVKRAHLRLLIEIRNALEPDQRRKLQALKD